MILTKENLQKRIASLEKDKEQLIANLNGCAGAIQITKDLLADLEKPEPTPETPPASPPAV